jgi:hypothetical protein
MIVSFLLFLYIWNFSRVFIFLPLVARCNIFIIFSVVLYVYLKYVVYVLMCFFSFIGVYIFI